MENKNIHFFSELLIREYLAHVQTFSSKIHIWKTLFLYFEKETPHTGKRAFFGKYSQMS